jgi:hypothetical protein
MNWKGFGRKQWCPKLRYLSQNMPEGAEKNKKNGNLLDTAPA